MKRYLFAPLALVTVLLTFGGCASLPAKQQSAEGHASVERSLALLQDGERRACNPQAFAKSPSSPVLACEGPLSQSLGLTTARHQEIAAVLAEAFLTQQRLGAAILLWQPGTATPTEISDFEKQVQAALRMLQALAPGEDQKRLISAAQAVIDELKRVVAAARK